MGRFTDVESYQSNLSLRRLSQYLQDLCARSIKYPDPSKGADLIFLQEQTKEHQKIHIVGIVCENHDRKQPQTKAVNVTAGKLTRATSGRLILSKREFSVFVMKAIRSR